MLRQMRAPARGVVGIGPEVGDPGYLAVTVELEEAQPGLRPGVSEAVGLRSLQAIRTQLTAVLTSPRAMAASGGG